MCDLVVRNSQVCSNPTAKRSVIENKGCSNKTSKVNMVVIKTFDSDFLVLFLTGFDFFPGKLKVWIKTGL